MQLVRFCLAVISLTDLVLYQKIFQPIREVVGWKHDRWGNTEHRKPVENSKILEFFGEASECFRCTSVWMAIVLTIISFLPFSGKLETLLAGSWVASELNTLLNRYYNSKL